MTANNYRLAADQLAKAGWVCTGGMYPNSNADAGEQVSWTGHFERKDGRHTQQFWLTPLTLGTPQYADAVYVPPTEAEEWRLIASAIWGKRNDGWRVVAPDVNWENPELFCDHCSERIQSAYAEDKALGGAK